MHINIIYFFNRIPVIFNIASQESPGLLKILSFYNSCIEKPKVKTLNNVQLLKELPFYDDLNIVKNKTAFIGYARSYKLKLLIKEMLLFN